MTSPATSVQPVPATPDPGWTSSEFLSTVGVHLLSLLAILLDLLHVHWAHGLSSMQAAIPIAALSISALLQFAYQDHRTALKIQHVAKAAEVRVAQIKAGVDTVSAVAGELSPQTAAVINSIEGVLDVPAATSSAAPVPAADASAQDVPPPSFDPPVVPVDPEAVTDPRQG